jgi:rod shape-determining protein MreD
VIPSPNGILRLGLLTMLVVVLQISSVAQVRLLGSSVDLVPLLVGAVGLLAGAVPAATIGFVAGFLLDLSLGQNLGASSLVLTAVGYGVGRYREVRDPAHGLTPIPVSAAATAGYLAGFASVSFMLEIQSEVSVVVLRDMFVTVLLNALIAVPVFAIIRRVLRPALVVDPLEARRRRRRRRAQPAGPIGLRGLEV